MERPVEESSRRRLNAAALLAVALAAITFARVLTFDFAYDDHWTITQNRFLERPLLWLLWQSLTGRAVALDIPDSTRPSMIFSTWVDHRIFQLAPEGYHLHSLVLYCVVCAVAVYALFCVSRNLHVAAVGGAFFAVAPVHAEVVAAVNYREDLIAALGVLASVCFLFARRCHSESRVAVLAIALLFLYALFGKESAVALPLVAGAILAVRRPRRAWFVGRRLSLFSLGGTLTAWGMWRAFLRLTGRDDVPLTFADHGLGERLLRTCRYSVRAVINSIAPVFWSPDHPTEGTPSLLWVIAFLLLLLGAYWLARRRRTRSLAVGVLVAIAAALPTAPLLGPYNETADRFFFLSVFGGALVWGWVAQSLSPWLEPRALRFALAIPLFGLFWGSQSAAGAWQNDATLWATATSRSPESSRAWAGHSRVLRLAGRLGEAQSAADRAVTLEPTFLTARVTRVYVLLRRGEITEARNEIAVIDRLNAARQKTHPQKEQRGMRRARRCAQMDATEAARCIHGA